MKDLVSIPHVARTCTLLNRTLAEEMSSRNFEVGRSARAGAPVVGSLRCFPSNACFTCVACSAVLRRGVLQSAEPFQNHILVSMRMSMPDKQAVAAHRTQSHGRVAIASNE